MKIVGKKIIAGLGVGRNLYVGKELVMLVVIECLVVMSVGRDNNIHNEC
jgi:hypothetical protein